MTQHGPSGMVAPAFSNTIMNKQSTTDFGYQEVAAEDKQGLVSGVFDSVASRYDLMNDVLSFGIHRVWKRYTLELCGLRPGHRLLDIAGGTGDLAIKAAERVGDDGQVILADINANMLQQGRDRVINQGLVNRIEVAQCNAEHLPLSVTFRRPKAIVIQSK